MGNGDTKRTATGQSPFTSTLSLALLELSAMNTHPLHLPGELLVSQEMAKSVLLGRGPKADPAMPNSVSTHGGSLASPQTQGL